MAKQIRRYAPKGATHWFRDDYYRVEGEGEQTKLYFWFYNKWLHFNSASQDEIELVINLGIDLSTHDTKTIEKVLWCLSAVGVVFLILLRAGYLG